MNIHSIRRWWPELIVLLALLPWARAVFHLPLNDDAGYFLPLAREFLAGKIPYRDLFTWHTPLGPWLFAPIAGLRGAALQLAAPLWMLGWVMLDVWLLGNLMRKLGCENSMLRLGQAFFLTMALVAGGGWITLEPVYLSGLLWAWNLSLQSGKRAWFLAGLALGLAFLVKQFALIGLLMLLPMAVRSKRSTAFLAGWALPVLLVLAALAVAGVAVGGLPELWFRPPGLGVYLGKTLPWSSMVWVGVPGLLWLGAGLVGKGNWQQSQWPAVAGLAAATGLWLWGGNDQYSLLWLAMVLAFPLRSRWLAGALVALSLQVSVIWLTTHDSERADQLLRADWIEARLRPGDSYLIAGPAHQVQYALLDAKPPLPKEAGYQVFTLLPASVQTNALQAATLVLMPPEGGLPDSLQTQLVERMILSRWGLYRL